MKTLKAVVAKYNSISLILRILVGLAVGVVLALVAPGAGWVAEFGSLFVGALKGIAPVLVFVIVASALAQGSSRLDRRFGTVIWLYMLTTFLAAALAAVTSFMFPVKVVLADAADKQPDVKEKAAAFAEGYKNFLDHAKTEREAAATSEQMLRASSSSPCTNTAYSRRDARSPVV